MDQTANPGPQGGASAPASGPASGIVSVNDRGGASRNVFGKVIFFGAIATVLVAGTLVTVSRINVAEKAKKAETAAAAKSENKPASVPDRRHFEAGAPAIPGAPAAPSALASGLDTSTACADGTVPSPVVGADGRPVGRCQDGRYIVPALDPAANGAPPVPTSGATATNGGAQAGAVKVSRYAGDVLLSGAQSPIARNGVADMTSNPLLMMALAQQMGGPGTAQAVQVPVAAISPPGSVGSLLRASDTPKVSAGKIGDRNMILPKGRTIDCGMTMRIISDIAGLTSCVLSQNVYSDNGRVVLLERGSEATGEYRATMEQGQRRLFVIWTRIKTPSGVVINLDSPGADALGTAGMTGKVDNHWWQRVGGAFLLSTVKDAIAYKLAQTAGNSAGGGVLYQNTQSTGDQLSARMMEATINIRPTLYVNQGDRASIYVARDLDFGSVYELRAN